MLRTRYAGARTPCAGHYAKGGFGGAQAGGSPTRPTSLPAVSLASVCTVGMQFERGPGSPEGTAAAVGFLIG